MFPKDESVQIFFCFICGGPGTTRHHFVPRHARKQIKQQVGNYETVRACSHCHNDIHYYFSNWELAMKFNTAPLLVAELKTRKLFTVNSKQ